MMVDGIRPNPGSVSIPATFLTQEYDDIRALAATDSDRSPKEVGVLLRHEVKYRASSISSLLHKKLQEVKETDDELAAMKDSCAERLRNVNDGEKRFLKKQTELKTSIEAFESYILDNDSKRLRAIKKATEQRKIREQKEVQLEKLKEMFDDVKRQRDSMLVQLRYLKRYEHYLTATVRSEPHWQNIDELLNRHRVLVTANDDLAESAARSHEQLEEAQMNLQKLLKDKTNEILVKNSEVAQHMTKLEESANRIQQAEMEALKLDQTTIGIASRMAQIQMSTTNLYNRVLRSYEQRRPKMIEPNLTMLDKDRQNIDFLSRMLDEIGDRVVEIDHICSEYRPEAVTTRPPLPAAAAAKLSKAQVHDSVSTLNSSMLR